jgi:glycosyltransferase involved in cell wall biosynthesis
VSGTTVSVVTATYQRADTLPRLYESLCAQTATIHEWVVVDDGSTDGSYDLVRGWAEQSPFAIVVHRQENQGKHAAFNRVVELATGEFCALIDSDDWYLPGAVAGMIATWESIPPERRARFANVEGRRVDDAGVLLGDPFPQDVFDSDAFEIEALHGRMGDTVGMYRRDILAGFPYPETLGWHISPALVWNRIAARYSTRFVNEVWAYTDYQPTGLSGRETELRLRFAAAQLLYWREFAAMPRRMTPRNRLRANVNAVRYALLEGDGLGSIWRHRASGLWTAAALPIGFAFYLRDRRQAGSWDG